MCTVEPGLSYRIGHAMLDFADADLPSMHKKQHTNQLLPLIWVQGTEREGEIAGGI